MYEDEPLKDYYTLMDIAYIYTWRRVRNIFAHFLFCFLSQDVINTLQLLSCNCSVLIFIIFIDTLQYINNIFFVK